MIPFVSAPGLLWVGLGAWPLAAAAEPPAPPPSVGSSVVEQPTDANAIAQQRQLELELRQQRLDALEAEIEVLRARLEEARPREPDGTVAAGAARAPASGRLVVPTRVDSDGERDAHVVVRLDDDVGDAVAYGEDLVVLGRVRGDATAFGGDVRVGPEGRIEGDAVSFGGEVRVDDGGSVEGNRIAMATPVPNDEGLWPSIRRRLVFMLSFAGAGVLGVALFPDRISRVAETIGHHPVRSGVAGTALGIGLSLLAVLFAVLIVPLPLAVALVAVLGVAWMMGFVGLCQAVGDRLPFRERHHGRWVAFLLGTLAVSFVSAMSWLGVFALVVVSVVGLGAALSTRLGARPAM